MHSVLKVDLGCGTVKREGFVGVDRLPLPGVDIVHDLENVNYPFKDNEVDELWMDQVLEHLRNPVRVVEEIYRICKHGALIHVGVPYFRSMYAVIDPTHVNFFGVSWFSYFDPKHPFYTRYAMSKIRLEQRSMEFDREAKVAGTLSPFRKLMVKFAERKPVTYEARLSHLFPLDSLTFHLQVDKSVSKGVHE